MGNDSTAFSVPLGPIRRGRLVFASGASQIRLIASQTLTDLYRAQFKGHVPGVLLHGDTLTIHYRPLLDAPVSRRLPLADILLNGVIPWEMEFRKGVSELKADLRGLPLQSLDLLGGASKLVLILPKPAGVAYIYIAGGIRQAVIRRPAGVGVRMKLNGAVSRLAFDGQRLDAIKGETRLESANFSRASGRYELDISGAVNHLTIKKDDGR
ncbi:MAG: hypothetical protein HZC41_03170 [Chloroflexi bacterium]|nr:hypothetical protein [Chloroflexota bacterium]